MTYDHTFSICFAVDGSEIENPDNIPENVLIERLERRVRAIKEHFDNGNSIKEEIEPF